MVEIKLHFLADQKKWITIDLRCSQVKKRHYKHQSPYIQYTFLYQCFSLNIDDRVAKFYMIDMALLSFLSCNFGTDWLEN